jgi:Putative zinc-finger
MNMDCQETELWFSLAFDGRLGVEERRQFEAHIDGCSECRGSFIRYESLFSAVRAIPSTTTSSPAPLPTGASSFGRAKKPSLILRAARIVGAAGLLVAVGLVAYEFGNTAREAELGPEPVAVAKLEDATARASVPAKMPGGYLHRLVRGTKNLGLMVESAGSQQDRPQEEAASALRVIDDFVRSAPLDDDARRLQSFDAASLRDFTAPVHAFARDVSRLVAQARSEADRGEEPKVRLARVQSLFRQGSLRQHVRSLESLAELYPLPPRPPSLESAPEGAQSLSAHRALSGSVEFLVCGDRGQAGNLLRRALLVGDPSTRRLAQCLAFGNQVDVKGLHFFKEAGAPGAPRTQFRFFLPREAATWMTQSPSLEVLPSGQGRGIVVEFPEREFEIEIRGAVEFPEATAPSAPPTPRLRLRRRL